MNRGMQISRSLPFSRQIRRSHNVLVQILNHKQNPKQKYKSSKVKMVNLNAIVNFAQIVKKNILIWCMRISMSYLLAAVKSLVLIKDKAWKRDLDQLWV